MLEQAVRRDEAAPRLMQAATPALRSPRGMAFTTREVSSDGVATWAKRGLDVLVALAALGLLGPVMLIAAAAIRLDSPGPVFIRQERVSKGLRRFRMLKFRSMVVNAHELLPSLEALNEATPPLFKMKNDPRMTRVGRHLRRLSVDELPQLINVLKGDMSLVGPRPPLVHEVAFDYRRQSSRLRRPPGMTGLWQVSGRSDLGYDEMVTLDLRYVRDWSLLLDLAILLRTPAVVITGKGAR